MTIRHKKKDILVVFSASSNEHTLLHTERITRRVYAWCNFFPFIAPEYIFGHFRRRNQMQFIIMKNKLVFCILII